MTATTQPYPIHAAALPAALLMGLFRRIEEGAADNPPPLPPPLEGLERAEFERRMIRAGLKIVGIRQDELADRLGINEAVLSRKLTGITATTALERHLFAVALFVPDRAEMSKIQQRCAGYEYEQIDKAWLAPTVAATASRGGSR